MAPDSIQLKHEIENQIMFCEICFTICHSINEMGSEITAGRGPDFLPFYYNLNFTKGLLLLHALLLSQRSDELTIKNFITRYKNQLSEQQTVDFQEEIDKIAVTFEELRPKKLRHKVAAHLDLNFRHTDFLCGYILPNLVPKYLDIISSIKNTFFKFLPGALLAYPIEKITSQSEMILKIIVEKKHGHN